jgi:hypothetical protein
MYQFFKSVLSLSVLFFNSVLFKSVLFKSVLFKSVLFKSVLLSVVFKSVLFFKAVLKLTGGPSDRLPMQTLVSTSETFAYQSQSH